MTNTTDKDFLRSLSLLNMAALEASHSAEFLCVDTELRSLAEQLVIILGRIYSECRSLAQGCGVTLSEDLDGGHRDELAALERMRGAAFEQAYLRKYAIDAQLELIRLCEREVRQGSDPAVASSAEKWLADLRSALALARSLPMSDE